MDDSKYLGSSVGSKERDVKFRIGHASAEFAKLKYSNISNQENHQNTKSISRSVYLKRHVLLLMYGSGSWILTEALNDKFEMFVRKCYLIILGIKQSKNHVTYKSLYQLTCQIAVRRPVSASLSSQ